jgi:presequence protease
MDHCNFSLIKEQEIPELRTRARLFRHGRSGAELLSLENEDENKVFGINFRTPPPDSTGVPHIMEHAVLGGSRRFPVREPFVELLKGSLKTFVNAFTFPDKTGYPVASQNVQDFYNLIDVYMDAVLYPLILPRTLQQEGWHYSLESLDAPLNYKGIVFNEMKGAYSSPDSVLNRYSQQSLFPGHVYGLDSGGDPQVIPDLTYEQFRSFHDTYYHPSNARIFFYGDDDPDMRLQLMDGYLKDFSYQKIESTIPRMQRFTEPRRVTYPYSVGEDGAASKHMLTINWLLDESRDPQVALGLHILAHILIGTPASPLRKALIDSGLGEDLAGGGLEPDLREMIFSTGLKGLQSENTGKVESLIFETLSGLADAGIDPGTVAASVNTVEFQLRENNTGSFPRGILLMIRALETWNYDGDPLVLLVFEQPLEALKQRLAGGERMFENLIKHYFLDNPHRTVLVLEPDPELNERAEAAERLHLDQVRQNLSQDELAGLVESTRLLKLHQETPDSPDALATIPTLKLSDLEPKVKTTPCEEFDLGGVRSLYHDLFTNGIVYLDLGLDLHQLPQELLPYVPLFGRALVEMGTQDEDFVRLSQRVGRTTGGIRATAQTSAARAKPRGEAWLFVRGKCTPPQTGEMLSIFADILFRLRLDESNESRERFRQIVLEEKANQEARLVPAGHMVVSTRLRALFSESEWASEQMSGVSYLFFLRRLAERIDQDWPGVLSDLERLRSRLLNRRGMLCNVTVDTANWQALRLQLQDFLETIPGLEIQKSVWQPKRSASFEGLTIPARVNYVGKGADLYALGYHLDGSMMVIRNTLRTTWLWERVRVQGGAYGGSCLFDPRSGIFNYYSYRDPNLLQTLDVYDRTAQYLLELELGQEELVKSIIGAIGEMDAYQLPDARGFTSMLRTLVGETDAERQLLRDQLLSTTLDDFRQFADVLDAVKSTGKVVVLGSQAAIEAANQERGGWLEVNKVL